MDARINSIKSIWKSMNSIYCYKNDHRPNVNINNLVSDQGPIKDGQEIVNHFNTYFSSIGDTLASKVVSTTNEHKKFLPSPKFNSIFINPVTENEVFNSIMSLKKIIPLEVME